MRDRDAGNTPPLISMIIATHDRWPVVLEAVDSVTSQRRSDLGVIVVDDGSTDGTADRLETERPEVCVIRQDNGERGAARNCGLRRATGRFVAFLDSDDVVEPWYVSQFADRWEALERSERIYVCALTRWDPITGSTRPWRLEAHPRGDRLDAALRSTQWGPGCMIVPRATALSVGGFPVQRAAAGSEDWLFQIRIVATGLPVEVLPVPSVRLRMHRGRSVNDDQARIAGRQAALEILLTSGISNRPLELAQHRLAIAGTHHFCAAHAYRSGEMVHARTHLRHVRRQLGVRTQVAWSGQLWLQTWLGARLSAAARDARARLADARDALRRPARWRR
jgi:glycosyltransferase involved in cell wall biosynthesis